MPVPSPSLVDSDVVSIALAVDGTDVTDSYEILSVHVSKAANRIPLARIVIRDGSASDEVFAASDADDFSPGNEITVKAGYHQQVETIFDGIIIKHGIRKRGG